MLTVEQALIDKSAQAICRVLGGDWSSLPQDSDGEFSGRKALREAAKAGMLAGGLIWVEDTDPNPPELTNEETD